MSRLTKNKKNYIIKLINEGKSISRISKATHTAKSTIYYYYKKLKGKRYKPPKFSFSEEDLGEFIGIFAGDGCFYYDKKEYKYTLTFSTGFSDKRYNECILNFFTRIFNKKPMVISRSKENVFIIKYYSKEIFKLIKTYLIWHGFKTYSVHLRSITDYPKDFYIGFLRGLFDTDGSFYKPKSRLSYGTVSKELALQVLSIIKSYGFHPNYYVSKQKNRSKFHTIALHGDQSRNFIKLINPRNTDKIARQWSSGKTSPSHPKGS